MENKRAFRYTFNTVEILKDVKEKLFKATNLDVFMGARPTASAKHRDEMLVVSLPYSIRNKGAIQESYLRIEIIVKDKSEGLSNIAQLEQLANKIQLQFPLNSSRYHASIPNLVLTGKDTIGYTIWQLQGKMRINKADTY